MPRKKKVDPEAERKKEYEYQKKRWLEYPSEPSYHFKEGDKVRVGNLKDTVVKSVLLDGLGYEIDYTSIDKVNFKTVETPHATQCFAWYEVRPIPTTTESLINSESKVRLYYSQRALSGLILMRYCFGIDFSPDYQRDFVWTEDDKVNLIDSIFHKIDIGKFVFIKNDYRGYGSPGYEILDGKQRLNTLIEYYENKFPYKGHYYNDLCIKDRNFIENYNVSYAEVTNITQAEKYQLFLQLNTTGHVMSQDQLDKVKKLAEDIG